MTSSGLQDSALKIASRTYRMLRSADPFLWALYAFWDAENLKLGVQNEFETKMKSAVSSRNTIWKKVDDPNMKWRTKKGYDWWEWTKQAIVQFWRHPLPPIWTVHFHWTVNFSSIFYEDAFLSPKMLILVLLFWIASKNPDVLTDKHNIDHKRKILNISLLRSVLADFGWFWISAGNRVRIEISWRIYFIWILYIKYYINIFLYKWFKTCGVREDLWQAIPPWPLKFPFFFEGS